MKLREIDIVYIACKHDLNIFRSEFQVLQFILFFGLVVMNRMHIFVNYAPN